MKLVVIAVGGNAIIQEHQKGTIEEQFANVNYTCGPILNLIEEGYHVVLTHGNGPQVGNALLKVEAARELVCPVPLDVCGAETQGSLGHIIQQSFINQIYKRKLRNVQPVTIVTHTVVDPNDPAFHNPTKPIGPFYSQERANELSREIGISFKSDSGRGYRRVVASPKPKEIVEKDIIKQLVSTNKLVISTGGGGIPVIKDEDGIKGIEAVIDKDRASALLAKEINADYLIILTGVDQVAIHFGKPDQQFLSELTVDEAKKYLAEGEFPPGSMGPKIEAAIDFVESSGGYAIITSIEKLPEALKGLTGTRITK